MALKDHSSRVFMDLGVRGHPPPLSFPSLKYVEADPTLGLSRVPICYFMSLMSPEDLELPLGVVFYYDGEENLARDGSLHIRVCDFRAFLGAAYLSCVCGSTCSLFLSGGGRWHKVVVPAAGFH